MVENENDAVTPKGATHTTSQTNPTTQNQSNEKVESETDQQIEGFTSTEWMEKKPKLQEQFPELTEDDLKFEEGKHSELYERVQNRLDKTHFEVKSIIENLI